MEGKKDISKLLFAIGLIAQGATIVDSVHSTIAATRKVDQYKKENEIDKLPIKDVMKLVGKYYISTGLLEALSMACLIKSKRKDAQTILSVAAAYSASEGAYELLKDKIHETVSSKKESEIYEAVAKERVASTSGETYIHTPNGNTRCIEPLLGKRFYGDQEVIRKCILDINDEMLNEESASIGDLYYLLAIQAPPAAKDYEWRRSHMDAPLSVYFTSVLDEDGEPCLTWEYSENPKVYVNRSALA